MRHAKNAALRRTTRPLNGLLLPGFIVLPRELDVNHSAYNSILPGVLQQSFAPHELSAHARYARLGLAQSSSREH